MEPSTTRDTSSYEMELRSLVEAVKLADRPCTIVSDHEGEGWISRHYEPTIPPQVTYALTQKVMELDGVLTELDRIAERWYGANKPKPNK